MEPLMETRNNPKTEEPKKSTSLTTWILISLVAGIIAGLVCSVFVPENSTFDTVVIEGVLYVLGQWFIRLMQMIVVPLVFCSIVCGAASMSDPKMLGKVGLGTIAMYLLTTCRCHCAWAGVCHSAWRRP